MLNFSVNESNTIRSLARESLFDAVLNWTERGTVSPPNDNNDIRQFMQPCADLCNVMMDALLNLAFAYQMQTNALIECDSADLKKSQSIPVTTLPHNFVPVAELLMVIYLHAFPIVRPDLNLLDNGNDSVEDIVQNNLIHRNRYQFSRNSFDCV